MTPMLLIGGSGRSGTTILCRAMGRHPDVTDVPEWRFTTDPDGVIDFYTQATTGLQSPFHYDIRIKRLQALLRHVATQGRMTSPLGSSRVRQWSARTLGRNLAAPYARTQATDYSPNFATLSQQLIDDLTTFAFRGYWVGMHPLEAAAIRFSEKSPEEIRLACSRFLKAVADDVCRAQGAKAHLEKNTWNILCWDRTLEVLPDAKLVHIVRDPRDVVSSYGEQPWVPSDPIAAARLLRSVMSTWDEISRRVPEESFFEVRLEDLTAEPEKEFAKICEFWGLDWDPSLLETKLSPSSFGRWRADLPAGKLDEIQQILLPVMQKYGYV